MGTNKLIFLYSVGARIVVDENKKKSIFFRWNSSQFLRKYRVRIVVPTGAGIAGVILAGIAASITH